MQKGKTANVRYETAPRNGTLTYDSPACLKHLKLYLLSHQYHICKTMAKKLYPKEGKTISTLETRRSLVNLF